MGNTHVKLTEKQQYLFGRYPRLGIITALGLQNDAVLLQNKPSILVDINHNFEFLAWLLRDTMTIRKGINYDIDVRELGFNPYSEFIRLLSVGVKSGVIVKVPESSVDTIGLDELSSLLATLQPDELENQWTLMPEVSTFSLDTGLVIPASPNPYPFKNKLLRVCASASWIIEEKVVDVTGFATMFEFESAVSKVKSMTQGARVLDLDNLTMLNKPSWSKKRYHDQKMRISSESLSRFNIIKSLIERGIIAKVNTEEALPLGGGLDLGNPEDKPVLQIKTRRKTIPKAIRNQVWETYCGKTYNGRCYVCRNEVSIIAWEAGHVQSDAEGGDVTVENLRPICFQCNRSMGKKSMWDYIRRHHPDRARELNL